MVKVKKVAANEIYAFGLTEVDHGAGFKINHGSPQLAAIVTCPCNQESTPKTLFAAWYEFETFERSPAGGCKIISIECHVGATMDRFVNGVFDLGTHMIVCPAEAAGSTAAEWDTPDELERLPIQVKRDRRVTRLFGMVNQSSKSSTKSSAYTKCLMSLRLSSALSKQVHAKSRCSVLSMSPVSIPFPR